MSWIDLDPQVTGPQETNPQVTGPQDTAPQASGRQATGPQATCPQATGPKSQFGPSWTSSIMSSQAVQYLERWAFAVAATAATVSFDSSDYLILEQI